MGKRDTRNNAGAGDPLAAPARLTPIDIQQKEFRVSRFGGYKMRDVDEFLDRITDSFSALTTEVERLRTGSGSAVVGTPDLDDVARQADEIIARARADAARITAEARAAGTAAAVSTGGPQDRAAVNAFITREREFLQSLAGLVQVHAETVKGMAKSTRATARPQAAEPSSQAEAASSVSGAGSAQPVVDDEPATTLDADDAPASATSPPATAPESRPTAPEPTMVPESEATVRLEEPAAAAARNDRGDGDAEGDRSLRELFWGED
jgi:DivIVA domain-containing protein